MINLIVVMIVDLTDFPDTLKKILSWIISRGKIVTTNYRFHLFDCSLCITWWLSIIYVLIFGKLTILSILLCISSALFTKVSVQLINLIIDAILVLINTM